MVNITPEPGNECTMYACPRACWDEHLEAWRRQRQRGNKSALEPMPGGHCMFERPTAYGCVRYGDDTPESKRAAWEVHVRGMLHGWDANLTTEQRDRIVSAVVEAKLAGQETGALPFVACLMANL